ncbi:SpoIID/LytB domain-containing protein [Paenibacillus harenae]|uniref:SpoIID/LytB domain-containing protein n=1 Tax=Paenibacillus harenae TaxID=306543 RepID=UPI0027945602|nr:SpoIID/LytB domain-containing protein [Paenibacillus harenae]MDQ0061306.1 stage II sporulation protein D [Paenibacillus harenae]
MSMSIKRLSLTALSALLFISLCAALPAQAAVPKLDTIRVAMYLQLPEKKYTDTTAAVTFSAAGGLSIGTRTPSGIQNWFKAAAGSQTRFALDSFKVKVFESSNFASAQAAYKRIIAAKGAGYLTSLTKKGSIVYQVAEGTYAAIADAKAAVTRWAGDAELAKLTAGFKPMVQGPFRLETPALASKAAAVTAMNGYAAAGLDAYVAVRVAAAGAAAYSVMVGSAADAAELQIVKTAAADVAGAGSLKQADTAAPYLLLKNDHAVTGKADISLELYGFPAADMKVWVESLTADPIKLTERSSRTYRGQFEVSALNGAMAVVNELPFEHYLYSVVGGEMYSSWPAEALKSQAVTARTYGLYKGFGFQIAHVVDTVLSQAYNGVGSERPSTIDAVEATRGEVLLHNGKPIEALYSANAGGMTSDATEVWNNSIPYLQAVKSPDGSSETGLHSWYRVVLSSGAIGYIREDLLDDTGSKTAAGSMIMQVNTNGTKVRQHPIIQDAVALIATVDSGTKVTVLEKTIESNSMNWVRGPYKPAELLTVINARVKTKITGPIRTLEVSERGPSGRATQIMANGTKLEVANPDVLRATLGVQGSLPSTKFQIDETAKVAMMGAGSQQRTKPEDSNPVYIVGAGGKVTEAKEANLFILSGDGHLRAATKEPTFRFVGTGNGHGVGMSQYGALSLAQQGYDYQYILKYYYKDVTIAKE